jgi:hypothetical protein
MTVDVIYDLAPGVSEDLAAGERHARTAALRARLRAMVSDASRDGAITGNEDADLEHMTTRTEIVTDTPTTTPIPQPMSNTLRWAKILAGYAGTGIPTRLMRDLRASMDLTSAQIHSLLARASRVARTGTYVTARSTTDLWSCDTTQFARLLHELCGADTSRDRESRIATAIGLSAADVAAGTDRALCEFARSCRGDGPVRDQTPDEDLRSFRIENVGEAP